jgi:MFS family permease
MAKYSHRNVHLMLCFSFFSGLASAIAQAGLFDTFLYILSSESNSAVGLAESISGITQVLAVLPSGYIADKFSRSAILRICAGVSVCFVFLSVLGVYYDSVSLVYSSLVVFGMYSAVESSASFALFSDSLPQGDRALWMSRVAVLTQVAMGVGPLVSLVMFYYLGNEWSPSILKKVLVFGFILFIPANAFLLTWKDIPPSVYSSSFLAEADHPFLERLRVQSLAPYLICLNDVITCVGAGMTVKFFPLFFKNDYGLSPMELQGLFAVNCLSFAIFTWLCERLASRIGRVQGSLLFSMGGVACLFTLAYVRWLPLVIFVFVLRGALQNSIYPIDRSIIMDFVPSKERGRWNSIESLSAMTWSGSAVVGGYLMDNHDYRYTFVITGYIYLIACCMRIPLLWMVPKRERFVQAKTVFEDLSFSPRVFAH